jgi:hypothetical protein
LVREFFFLRYLDRGLKLVSSLSLSNIPSIQLLLYQIARIQCKSIVYLLDGIGQPLDDNSCLFDGNSCLLDAFYAYGITVLHVFFHYIRTGVDPGNGMDTLLALKKKRKSTTISLKTVLLLLAIFLNVSLVS